VDRPDEQSHNAVTPTAPEIRDGFGKKLKIPPAMFDDRSRRGVIPPFVVEYNLNRLVRYGLLVENQTAGSFRKIKTPMFRISNGFTDDRST
jgi:hypothetical protein